MRGDRGAGSVLMLAMAASAIILTVMASMVGHAVVDRHRAQAAADLSALAAAGPGGCAAARRVASANGACLVSCTGGTAGPVSVNVSQPCSAAGARAHARAGPALLDV